MDIEQDLRDAVLGLLPHDPADRTGLQKWSAHNLLTTLHNWWSRLIPAMPRRVHRSNTLALNQAMRKWGTASGVARVVRKIERGEDLTPHLSTRIQTTHEPVDGSKWRADLDLMLNHWGIHHLHLGHELRADGHVDRTGDLLYAAFTPTDAYLIDVRPHGHWASQDLIAIVARNWPDAGIIHRARHATGLAGEPPTDDDVADLRKAGVNTGPIPVDGHLWWMGSGLTLAGASLASSRWAMAVIAQAQHAAGLIAGDEAAVLRGWPSGVPIPEARDWHVTLVEDRVGLHERVSGVELAVDFL